MKTRSLLFAVSLLALLPWSVYAQTVPVSAGVIPTSIPTAGALFTPTPVPRVTVSPADDEVQPPADGPGDDMGFLGISKGTTPVVGTITPINFESMQSILSTMVPSVTPTAIAIPTLPAISANPVATKATAVK